MPFIILFTEFSSGILKFHQIIYQPCFIHYDYNIYLHKWNINEKYQVKVG